MKIMLLPENRSHMAEPETTPTTTEEVGKMSKLTFPLLALHPQQPRSADYVSPADRSTQRKVKKK